MNKPVVINNIPKFNLQPKFVVQAAAKEKIPIWPLIPIILIAISLLGYNHFLQVTINKQITEINNLNFKLRDYKKTINDYESEMEKKKYLIDKINFVKGVSKSQELWVNFMDEFSKKIPQDIWIDSLDAQKEGKYKLSGHSFSYAAIGNFMLYLNSISSINNVKLLDASKAGKETESQVCSFKIEGDIRLSGAPKEVATAPFRFK